MQFDDKRFVKVEPGKELDNASLKPGDLLVFGTKNADRPKVNHIGIACGDGTFVQADAQSREGAVIISQCSNPFFKQRFMGAARLSAKVDINIAASR
jgi:cell wall-associated NlpC family hydrolase